MAAALTSTLLLLLHDALQHGVADKAANEISGLGHLHPGRGLTLVGMTGQLSRSTQGGLERGAGLQHGNSLPDEGCSLVEQIQPGGVIAGPRRRRLRAMLLPRQGSNNGAAALWWSLLCSGRRPRGYAAIGTCSSICTWADEVGRIIAVRHGRAT